jgi:hypothetical protein
MKTQPAVVTFLAKHYPETNVIGDPDKAKLPRPVREEFHRLADHEKASQTTEVDSFNFRGKQYFDVLQGNLSSGRVAGTFFDAEGNQVASVPHVKGLDGRIGAED